MRSLFLCGQYTCKISPEACAGRQERAHRESYNSELSISLDPCCDCEQGKRMAWEMTMNKLTYPCRECGKEEAILSKKTGKPLPHGLCRTCFGDKIRSAKERAMQEPEKERTDHPNIREAIRVNAASQSRTVEQQIMWDVLQVSKNRPVEDPADL